MTCICGHPKRWHDGPVGCLYIVRDRVTYKEDVWCPCKAFEEAA